MIIKKSHCSKTQNKYLTKVKPTKRHRIESNEFKDKELNTKGDLGGRLGASWECPLFSSLKQLLHQRQASRDLLFSISGIGGRAPDPQSPNLGLNQPNGRPLGKPHEGGRTNELPHKKSAAYARHWLSQFRAGREERERETTSDVGFGRTKQWKGRWAAGVFVGREFTLVQSNSWLWLARPLHPFILLERLLKPLN